MFCNYRYIGIGLRKMFDLASLALPQIMLSQLLSSRHFTSLDGVRGATKMVTWRRWASIVITFYRKGKTCRVVALYRARVEQSNLVQWPKSAPRPELIVAPIHLHTFTMSISPPTQPLYGTLGKKNPPPAPPKRASSSSISAESEAAEPIYGRSAKSSPLPLPPPPPVTADSMSLLAYSDDSEDFPPPPAPITASDSYLQHGQHASSAAASVRERLDNILQRTGAGHWPARPHSQQSHYGVPNATTSRPK